MKFPWTKKSPEPEPPLISVITPTWQRHDWLLDCVKSVVTQAYPRIEHVVVSDGPDPALRRSLAEFVSHYPRPGYSLIVECMPEHSDDVRDHRAKLHAISLSCGSLLAYADDDQTYYANHLGSLQLALAEHPEAGFAYSSERVIRFPGDPGFEIGEQIPRFGQIDNAAIMHRRNLLDIATWKYTPGSPQCPDWDLVKAWIDADIKWIWTRQVTAQNCPTWFRERGW